MLYGQFSNARFDPQLFKRRLRAWDNTTAVDPSPGYKFRGTLVTRDSTEEALRAALLIVDAKSLYDSIRKTATGKGQRVALAVGEVRQSMGVLAAMVRWIPHNRMLADGLTNIFSKANLIPLLKAMMHES